MNIQFKETGFDVLPELRELATQKIEGLAKYFRGREEVAYAKVELGRAVGGQQTGRIWRAEINLDVKGATYRAESLHDTLENAVDEAVNELSRELRATKKKDENLFRKGGRMAKEFLRGFGRKG
ncbi:ribosome-associated translation inhibitor RaiA [Candidatus Parcubacteria bacterium]|nr:ribosome-associated translation inhibitor RaiA [Candidatus Parcubacteria bacterium]